jgi:hypothetical protein
MQFSIKRRDSQTPARIVESADLFTACAELSAGGTIPLDVVQVAPSAAIVAAPINSTFAPGGLVHDDAAKARIEGQHAALNAAGITVNAKEQFYATGTRMADQGYSRQNARQAEHAAKMPVRDAAAALVDLVRSEKRSDRTMSAREFADSIHVNGKIDAFGYALSVQSIRGLMGRIDSPALSYILGIQERCSARVTAANSGKADAETVKRVNGEDRAKIAEVLRHECLNASGERFKMRIRESGRIAGKPDCYAIVGEGYSPADAPDAVEQLMHQLPSDARASYAYDAPSTTWELRASVWTPTPVAEQAVGEAFEGYVSFQSRDNGTAKFRGGGGVTLIRCLNASTYVADDSSTARVHRGRILYAVDRMLSRSLRAIDALTTAWGTNRNAVLDVPVEVAGKRVTLEDAIPGFYMYMLRSKQSELVGVLPGKTREHAAGLTRRFFEERRDDSKLVRSDLAQGWTRYIQDQPSDVRRDAETAIGNWLVNGTPVKCDLGQHA